MAKTKVLQSVGFDALQDLSESGIPVCLWGI